MTDIQLRHPDEHDAPRLAELLGQLGYPSTIEQVQARMAVLAASPDDHVVIADIGGEAVGLATLHFSHLLQTDEMRCELTALVVDEQSRRLGIARRLVSEAENIARKLGASLFHLRSNKRREDAHAFYQAEGFEETHFAFNKTLYR